MNFPKTLSGKKISKIIQGTGQLGGYFEPRFDNDKKVINNIKYAFNLGMNAIDTAENYGGGHTETLIGKAIKNFREDIFISTKFDVKNHSRKEIINSVTKSMKRLSTDYIDLIQTHWPNQEVSLEEILDTLEFLKDKGIVLNYGLGNPSFLDLKYATKQNYKIFSIQTEYNLLERDIENEIKPFCDKNGIFTLAWSPLLGGRDIKKIKNSKIIKEIANNNNLSETQVILSWLNSKKNTFMICRTSNKKHMQENLDAAKIEINKSEIELIESEFKSEIINIAPYKIVPVDSLDRKVYKSLYEAIQNKYKMIPSPKKLSIDYLNGLQIKPIKVKKSGEQFILIEGRLKYWAWVIAFGDKKPIPTIIE